MYQAIETNTLNFQNNRKRLREIMDLRAKFSQKPKKVNFKSNVISDSFNFYLYGNYIVIIHISAPIISLTLKFTRRMLRYTLE